MPSRRRCTLQSTRAPSTANVAVTVDDTEVGTVTVDMIGEGCRCAHGGATGYAARGPLSTLVVLLLLLPRFVSHEAAVLAVVGRRRRRRSTRG